MYIVFVRTMNCGCNSSTDKTIRKFDKKDDLIQFLKEQSHNGRTKEDIEVYESKEIKIKKMKEVIHKPTYEIEI